MGKPADELDELLAEPVNAAVERERTAFDLAAAPHGEKIVLHGAGRFGKHILACMRDVGIEPLAFTDNNPTLEGSCVDNVPVFSPSKGTKLYGKSASFLVTVWNSPATDRMKQRVLQLKNLGCERAFPVGLLCWKYPEAFLPYYPLDLPHRALISTASVKEAFSRFGDEESRREFVGQMRFRLRLDYDAFNPPYESDQYFHSDLYDLKSDEVFIDCGAFDGDTVASFVRLREESFKAIVAFEPDPKNWSKLENRLEGLAAPIRQRIKPMPFALGSSAHIVQFDSTGTDVAKIGCGSVLVECVTLDESLREVAPSLIKFDIEGAELDALDGARKLIARSRPVLAVSCYHQQSHLWEIPLKLAAICQDYEYFLRPHGVEGWDLMCYAVPVERLKAR